MTRHCPIHTKLRQVRICRFCRADTSGQIPLAYSERGQLELVVDEPEKVSAEPPKPSRGAQGKRSWRMQPRIAAVLLILIVSGQFLAASSAIAGSQDCFRRASQPFGAVLRSSFGGETLAC